jgi:hypothetical protein
MPRSSKAKDIDPVTCKAEALPGVDATERGRKLLIPPSIGDLDGDGSPEIVVTSNEEYGLEPSSSCPRPARPAAEPR